MDYNSLKYIIAVDKHQSISKAAEELYLTQPNISKAIQMIEKELKIQIFTRTSKGVITTPQGKEFIKKAVKLINNFDSFVKEFSSNNQPVLNLNVAHPKDIFFQSKVVEISKKFDIENELNINVLEGTTEEIIEMVLKENVNLGIISVNEHDYAYYKKLLILNNLDFVSGDSLTLTATFHNSNPFTKEKIVNKNELKNQIFVTTNTNDYYKYYNEKYHIILSSKAVKVSTGFNQLAMLKNIKDSYLISLPIPQEVLDTYNCTSIPLDTSVGKWITMFIYKKTVELTTLEEELINMF